MLSHFLSKQKTEMVRTYNAVLLQWFFYFHHLPNFDVLDSPPEPSWFLAVNQLVAWGTESLLEDTKDSSCPPRAWYVYMGAGVRVFKGSTASFLPFPISHCTPSDAPDSFVLYDPSSPLELVHVLPAFPFPLPGALTLRQRNAFLKRWVISYPFQTVYLIPSSRYTQQI